MRAFREAQTPSDVSGDPGWVAALDRNDIEGAAGYFAVPSIAQNGLLFHLRTPDQVRAFNRSLPCGAHVVRASTTGRTTTATFRLSESPAPAFAASAPAGGR